MAIQLDPFHMLRAINCPESCLPVTAINVGQVTKINDGPITGPIPRLCHSDCTTGDSVSVYWNLIAWELYAQVQTCDQQAYSVKGRTNGTTREFDFTAAQEFGLDCKVLCGTSCFLEMPWGYLVIPTLDTPNNSWQERTPGVWRHYVRASFYQFATSTDFLFNERVDVSFCTYKLNISLIEDASPSTGVWITVSGHNIDVKENMTVSDTTNYDGVYVVQETDSTRIRVTASYVEDETSGTLTPKYD